MIMYDNLNSQFINLTTPIMTQQLTSPSDTSQINQNTLKFNNSSYCFLSSQSSNFTTLVPHNLLLFEEYTNQQDRQMVIKKNIPQCFKSAGLAKKKLTIKIDESYHCLDNKNQDKRQVDGELNCHQLKQKKQQQKDGSRSFNQNSISQYVDGLQLMESNQTDYSVRYYQLQSTFEELQKKYDSERKYWGELAGKLEMKDQQLKAIQQKCQYFQQSVQQKSSELQQKSNLLQNIEQRLRTKQQQTQQMKNQLSQLTQRCKYNEYLPTSIENEEKIRQRDIKIRELLKINQKMKMLNNDLLREVKINQKKVRDLEKELQNNLCLLTQENIYRLKQSSIKLKQKQKQNYERYNCQQPYNHHPHTTKLQRNSLHSYQNLNTAKERQLQVTGQGTLGVRKSLERRKTGQGNASSSVGQLAQVRKSMKMSSSVSSNTILNKKLIHK